MAIGTLLLLIALVIGVPVAYSFGLGSIFVVFFGNLKASMAAEVVFSALDSFPLMAIPFFILAGDLMKDSGISDQLVNLADVFLGKIKAKLCYVMILSCIFFGAVSGSAVATVAAVGGVLLPMMKERGYPEKISAALVAASGFIGILIPPSIPLVMYAITANVSVGELFLSTIIPGILLALGYAIVTKWYVQKGNFDDITDGDILVNPDNSVGSSVVEAPSKSQIVLKAIPALLLPVIILGGIYGGIVTPTEAAAVSVIYSLIVGALFYKGLGGNKIWKIFGASGLTIGVLMFLMCYVNVFGRALLLKNIPQSIAVFVTGLTDNKLIILLIINVFLLVVGMFMETNTAILILTPILTPLMSSIGVDPVHFGVMLTLNLGIGVITPPFATNLFVASKISGLSIADIVPPLMRYLVFACIPVLLLTTYIPQISLFLPKLLLR